MDHFAYAQQAYPKDATPLPPPGVGSLFKVNLLKGLIRCQLPEISHWVFLSEKWVQKGGQMSLETVVILPTHTGGEIL